MSLFDLLFVVHIFASVAFGWPPFSQPADEGLAPSECSAFGATAQWYISPSLSLRHSSCRGQDRIRRFFKRRLKMRLSATFSRRAYFSKPRMYGTTGGRGPVLNSGPRVER